MFDLARFIVDNLKQSAIEGSFTLAQINIFALNYRNKEQISENDFEEVISFANDLQTQRDAEEVPEEEPVIEDETVAEEETESESESETESETIG